MCAGSIEGGIPYLPVYRGFPVRESDVKRYDFMFVQGAMKERNDERGENNIKNTSDKVL